MVLTKADIVKSIKEQFGLSSKSSLYHKMDELGIAYSTGNSQK